MTSSKRLWLTPKEREVRIKLAGQVCGLTRWSHIANASGITHTGLTRAMGTDGIRLTTLKRLCDALGCTMDYLVYK